MSTTPPGHETETYGSLIDRLDNLQDDSAVSSVRNLHIPSKRKCINSILTLCQLVKNISLKTGSNVAVADGGAVDCGTHGLFKNR